MKKILLFLSIAILINSSCKKIGLCKDEELPLNKIAYSGNQLKIDGVYIAEPLTNDTNLSEIFILYSNGVLILWDYELTENLEESISSFSGNSKSHWGIFNINNTKIEIAHWIPNQCKYPSILRTGDITNDSTFVIKSITKKDGKKITSSNVNLVYHFKQFNSKPDSTNVFVK